MTLVPRPGAGFQRCRARLAAVARRTLALLLASGLGAGASAQTVTGMVRESGSLRPLPTAWVALVDEAGTRVTATASGPDGRFLLKAPTTGVFRLQTRLIGYDDTTSEPFVLAPNQTRDLEVFVTVRVFELEGIEAVTTKECRSLAAAGPRLAATWAEARIALEILEWTKAEQALLYHVTEYRRVVDAETLEVRDMTDALRRGVYSESPYASIPAEDLVERGYVTRTNDGSGEWDFWAPDGSVMLSDSFLDTHCFGIHPDSDDERVGLSFEPVVGRDLPEIEGVLWLDGGTAELETLEFRYINLPFPAPDSPFVGGDVEFERLATGAWIVRSWRIRMPREVVRSGGFELSRPIQLLRTLDEQGARVLRVGTVQGETLAQAVGATLTGSVRTAAAGVPLESAIIDIVPTGYRAVTGADGGYRVGDLPTGTFEVRVSHPWMEALGLDPARGTALLVEGEATRLALDIDVETAVEELCRGRPGGRIVYGTLRDPVRARPAIGVTVRVEAGSEETSDVSDEAGRWAVCVDAAVDSAGVAAAPPGGARTPVLRIALDDAPLVEAVLELEVPAATDAVVSAMRSVEADPETSSSRRDEVVARLAVRPIIGRVLDASTRRGIEAAEVALRSASGAVVDRAEADETGGFTLQAPDVDTVTVEVSALGYEGTSTPFAPSDADARIEIVVVPSPIALGGLEVSVERRLRVLETAGFYRRQRSTSGDFLDVTALDLIGTMAPAQLVVRMGRLSLGRGREPFFPRSIRPDVSGRGRPSVCYPIVVVDGVRMRTAPDLRGQTDALFDTLVPPVESIAAIETYPSGASVPAQWRSIENNCGAIVVWTLR